MTSGHSKRGRFAQVLRAARTLLCGVDGRQPPPREPYVQGITASSAVICWVSERPDEGLVEYRNPPEPERKETDTLIGRRHAVALRGLHPGSTYHYHVRGFGGA